MRRCTWLFVLLLFLATPISSYAGSSEFIYGKAGDHWYKEADRGYFKIFGFDGEAAITLRSSPSFDSKPVQQLKRGEIVASDGFSHWGGSTSWQRISSGLDAGWIPQRNLVRANARLLPKSTIPVAGSCSGHAPVWTASWTDTLVRISLFPGHAELGIGPVLSSDEQYTSMLTASAGAMSIDLVLTAEACPLAQGQIVSGRTGVMIVTEPSGKRLLSGCCEATAASFTD